MPKDPYASLKHGLVGAWIPSISGSGLLLPDLSMRGNNGVLTGMGPEDWVASEGGRALDFDGVNDYVTATVANYVQYANPFSACVFVKLNSLGSQANIISTWHPSSSSGPGWQLAIDSNNKPSLLYVDSAGSNYIFFTADKALTTNVTHVCFSTTGSTNVKAFIDGLEQSVSSTTFGSGNPGSLTSTQLWIGARNLSGSQTFLNGQLDDIRIYNRALTESEIKLLASDRGIGFKPNKKLSRFSTRYTYQPPKAKVFEGVRVRDHDYASLRQGLVGAWCPSLFNGGSGNLLVDQSGRGNNGTLTNMGPEDWVASEGGRALDFDGVDDKVTLSMQNTASLTASCWVYSRNINNANGEYFVVKWGGVLGGLDFYLGAFQNNWIARSGDGSSAFSTLLQTPAVASQWTHLAVTRNPANLKLFVNGSEMTSTSAVGFQGGGSQPLELAFLPTNFQANCQLDDIRLYNRALTEAEIKLLASKRGIGLQPSPTRFIAKEKKTGLRRRILTGQP